MSTYGIDVWAALGDPSRRRIFACLVEGPRSVTELARDLPISRPAVSQHLNVLRQAHLVQAHPQGTRRIYQVDPQGLATLRAELDKFWGKTLENFRQSTEGEQFMTTTSIPTSVQRDIEVAISVERAFATFTEQFDRIKPREHNLLTVPITETVFETHVGGTVYDRGEDGSVCHFARVLVFEPPHRLVISWDITPHWQIETDPGRTSEVEVRFIALGAERTRVELEHRHLDHHGEGWQGERDGVASDGGWPLYLQRFSDIAHG